jgi:hypothetical protein
MTTMQSTEAVQTLAANLYQNAMRLAERPFVGGGKEISEFVEQLARNARDDLHSFLVIHPELEAEDSDWTPIREATATEELWEAFGA